MGLDFIRRAAKSFHKGLDRSRVDLCTPDLFTRQPEHESRRFVVTVRPNQRLILGEELCVRVNGTNIVAQRGMEIVAKFEAPPRELVQAIQESYGEACAIVHDVYELADTAEVTVC
jgi:hypothetical protein